MSQVWFIYLYFVARVLSVAHFCREQTPIKYLKFGFNQMLFHNLRYNLLPQNYDLVTVDLLRNTRTVSSHLENPPHSHISTC